MITTIISNNCTGGAVMHHMGMEFRTPTINLQILPEDYPIFCANLGEYMDKELYETRLLLQRDREKLFKMFGGIPDFPIGNVGDVLVCFQHYETFQEAKEKWNERKARIDYDHIGYIFHARGEEYKAELEQFTAMHLPNSLAIAEGFDADGAVRFDPPEGGNAFSAVDGEVAIVKAYMWRDWTK